MHGEGALTATLEIVSQPMGNETSQRADSRMTCTDTRFCADLVHAMASAILITMFHNLLAKIEYASLVMRQVPSVLKDDSIRDTAAALKGRTCRCCLRRPFTVENASDRLVYALLLHGIDARLVAAGGGMFVGEDDAGLQRRSCRGSRLPRDCFPVHRELVTSGMLGLVTEVLGHL